MMNIRVRGDFSRICGSELRSLTRSAAAHGGLRSEDVMVCSIFTLSKSCGSHTPMAICGSVEVRVISSGTFSIPPTTCLSKKPRMLASADCSFRGAKSR